MTVRKLWLLILVSVSVISILINTLVLTRLTDKYFSEYLLESYEMHVQQVIEYTKKILLEESVSFSQMAIELESHLIDPIIRIKYIDAENQVKVDVFYEEYMRLNRPMMMRNRNYNQNETKDVYTISYNNQLLGILEFTKYNSPDNAFVANVFKSRLLTNSVFSISIAFLLVLFFGFFISKKMSNELTKTSELALAIENSSDKRVETSFINEINQIRQSIGLLDSRLKLKQKGRKMLIDQLIHETRTPLTILKSYLEAIEDELIVVNQEELLVMNHQIENLTAIISNIGNMIDSDSNINENKVEQFELNILIRQIVNGLKVQFDKKNIKLNLSLEGKILLYTDKYKLSQVIYNVLTNAWKYTLEFGHVEIQSQLNLDNVKILIKDSGIGIAEKDLNFIFDAYYRNQDVVDLEGEGLGLYIAKENLKKINGDIYAISEKGNGSVFEIVLPISNISKSK